MKKNEEILAERVKLYDARPGPRVGDYVMVVDKVLDRITHIWRDVPEPRAQCGGGENGSYYLGNGYCSYSGGLNGGCLLSDLEETDLLMDGCVWFFDDDVAGAGRGVYFRIRHRVFVLRHGAEFDGR